MMSAEFIGMGLNGRKVGGGWISCCPAHDDREPSLSVRDAKDGKVLVHCFAGCDQERVIAILRSRGLWPEGRQHRLTDPGPRAPANGQPDRDAADRSSIAHAIWDGAVPARGTLAEAYLASRGLTLPHRPALF